MDVKSVIIETNALAILYLREESQENKLKIAERVWKMNKGVVLTLRWPGDFCIGASWPILLRSLDRWDIDKANGKPFSSYYRMRLQRLIPDLWYKENTLISMTDKERRKKGGYKLIVNYDDLNLE